MEGIEGALYTSLTLRQVGENNFDTEFVTSSLHLKEVLHVFFERFWDLIGLSTTFLTMNSESNTFFAIKTQVMLNGSSRFLQLLSSTIDNDFAIKDFTNDIDSGLGL
ncbi:TPA: hypothetical protein ACPHXL_004644 [Vibrio alginolyticus]|uniref:hypothetical protein n=1 Tax=Vibrio alginolyticus TaxID=663 RepID=UPI002277529E|nr:hypothetical protein [Vibrio alginolyticus]WAE58314.1 hypothetical protein OPR71_21885 [Vibrio alginolyticus]